MKNTRFVSTLLCSLILSVVTENSIAGRIDLHQWIGEQRPVAMRNLLRNISAPGTARGSVIASPSTSNPDYFYHWVRDAALVMDVIVDEYKSARDSDAKKELLETLNDYIQFSIQNQNTENPSGGLGEPKFNVDGSAFTGSWGRPQDDGPALRATTLIHLANVWINNGHESWVKERLYNGDKKSLIKRDLEYVSHHWRNTSFELWEEVKGHHFHTRMVQRRSMVEGARFAERMGDMGAADWYKKQAMELSWELSRHWNTQKNIIVETIDRDGGLDYKHSELDSAVILGVLHGETFDGVFSLSDERVLATAKRIEDAFYQLYPINRNGEPGVGIGRYPEDRYDGFTSNGQGNPWFINTAAFAEYYYRLAKEIEQRGSVRLTSVNENFYRGLGINAGVDSVLREGSSDFKRLLDGISAKGDSFMNRVKFHVDGSGSMSEQINRENGFMQGARDLTWSYASLLTAIRARR